MERDPHYVDYVDAWIKSYSFKLILRSVKLRSMSTFGRQFKPNSAIVQREVLV
jgi:hypothetical protein